MKYLPWLVAYFLLLTPVMAMEVPAVVEGSERYDWKSCIDMRSSECLNDCTTSENLDCQSNCMQLAKDKCQNDGYSPPEPSLD